MKVHPAPKKRNITLRFDIASTLSNALACRQKKLRRLPHIFAKVLELPFHSDADVLVEETSDCFRFVVNTDDIGEDIRAHTIEIYPGVTKIVIRGTNVLDLSIDELELDLWRFRLPASTQPQLAAADYNDGELVVTVPKDVNFVDSDDDNSGDGNPEEVWRNGTEISERDVLLFSTSFHLWMLCGPSSSALNWCSTGSGNFKVKKAQGKHFTFILNNDSLFAFETTTLLGDFCCYIPF